ncbi:MAG: ABC transporter permease [bacterium]
MLKNYLKITLRNLRKNPAYSFINIAGLAIGMASGILILLYVQEELTFDHFHGRAECIYRITETRPSLDRGERHFPFTMGPAGPALVAEFPEVVKSVRLRSRAGTGRFTVQHGENRFYESDHLFAEPSFFEIFDFNLLQGDPATALQESRSAVLTAAAAQKYFGKENAMGQLLSIERFGDFIVTGIAENPPHNSHLDFSMLLSFATLEADPGWKRYIESWDSDSFITYVLTSRPLDLERFSGQLPAFVQKYRGATPKEPRQLALQRLLDVHFGSAQLESDLNRRKGDRMYVYLFSLIALFILLIAAINYMNLATARAMKRAKEVGLRKVVGAHENQLIGQFLSEAILFTALALFLALVMVEIVLPAFNALADKQLALDFSAQGWLLAALLLLVVLVGVLSGSYPAFYLAKMQPAFVLKSDLRTGVRAVRLRQVLVITQFALSIIMIVATTAAYRQINFIRSKNLGFNQDQLLVVDINSGNTRRNFQAIKNEMARIPEVKSVAVSSRVPGEWKNLDQILVAGEGAPAAQTHTMFFMCVDQEFLRTFEIGLAAGRDLSEEMGTDTAAVVLNETAARVLGWQDPLGKEIQAEEGQYRARVVGVVKDFHFQSLHEKIAPLVLGHWNNPVTAIDYFTARVNTNDMAQTLSALQKVHEQFDQKTPFEYNFLDERLNDFYQTDLRVGKIFGISAALTIIIACLGLLGLAAFMAEQRTKEIGVRKVLGASVANILFLLSKDFTKVIAIATLIAAPIAYWGLQRWLQVFAYRITVGPEIFVLAGVIALLIALLTVSFQAIKAALSNPVEALRYE